MRALDMLEARRVRGSTVERRRLAAPALAVTQAGYRQLRVCKWESIWVFFFCKVSFVYLTFLTFLTSSIINRRIVSGHDHPVYCVSFDNSGSRVVTGSDDNNLKVWLVPFGVLLGVLRGHKSDICDIAISPDDSLVAAGLLFDVWFLSLIKNKK